jgi:hypothetical protein
MKGVDMPKSPEPKPPFEKIEGAPKSRGWMQQWTGRIVALTALLVAAVALMDATTALVNKTPFFTCSLRISFPWCKAPERDAIQHLMDFICSRGVLRNYGSWEVPNAVYASVKEIGNELENALGQLPTDSAARHPLQNMQTASRELLQNPTVFPMDSRPRPISGPLQEAIHNFRTVFVENTSQIVQEYALKGNCNLSAGLESISR